MSKRIQKIAGKTVAWVERSLEDVLRQAARLQHQAIEQRAHQLFVERGGTDGYDLNDWLRAKSEVLDSGEPEP
jgi:hypothetical protein